MQPAMRQSDRNQSGAVSGEFLIPDLCSPRPVFFMVLLTELLVLAFALASSSLPRFNWDLFATCSLYSQWVVLCSAALLCPLRRAMANLSLPMASFCALLIVALVAASSSVLAIQLYPRLTYGSPQGWWIGRNVLVALVLAGIALRYFYLQQQLHLREKSELQARLNSLRARIRPHFLFNTMNSIASLIESRPEEAEQAVVDLSELFRSSLQETDQPTTVADELRLCELYLGIEQLRLGDRLSVSWQIDEGLRDEPMPGLLLQPLVENAVYHGIAPLPEGGEISVELSRAGKKIQVRVDNPTPAAMVDSEGNQMALVNIEERLYGLYGPESGVEIERGVGYYRVKLHYPCGEVL